MVTCDKCKWYFCDIFGDYSFENCYAPENMKLTYNGRKRTISSPRTLNQNLDCKLFKERLWKHFFKRLYLRIVNIG